MSRIADRGVEVKTAEAVPIFAVDRLTVIEPALCGAELPYMPSDYYRRRPIGKRRAQFAGDWTWTRWRPPIPC